MKKTSLALASALLLSLLACTKYRNVPSKYDNFVAPTSAEIAFGSLRINEFICKGTDPGAVTHFGQATAKWFELYNPTKFDITLDAGQWYITDDLTAKTKFAVPTNTTGTQWVVPAGGFLGIMCVKEGPGGTTPAPGKINTDFSLSSTSGAIGVYYQKNPSTNILAVDTIVYNFGTAGANSGLSYGRNPDGVGLATNQLSKVTPEASNN